MWQVEQMYMSIILFVFENYNMVMVDHLGPHKHCACANNFIIKDSYFRRREKNQRIMSL